MQIRGIRLPDTEVFPCSRRHIKEVFGDDELDYVSFGTLWRTFRFDGAVTERPHVFGTVVASLFIDLERSASLSLYPVRRELYQPPAQSEFSIEVLPGLQRWLNEKQSRPDTAIVGYDRVVIEWTDQAHKYHELKPYF